MFASSVVAQPQPGEKVLVLPFRVYAGDDLAYLKDEIKNAIEENLKADGATIVTTEKLPVELALSEEFTPEKIRQVGRQAGADFVVWGSLTWIDEQYSVDANLIKTVVAEPFRSYFVAGKGVETVPGTVANLSRDLAFHIFKREKVVGVQIDGNQRIESDAIRKNIQTVPGDVFLTKSLSEDLKRIYAMGYFEDVRIEAEEGPAGKTIIFKVKEKPIIRKVKFQGNRVFDDDELMETLDIKTGSILNVFSIQRNIRRLEDQYNEKNYQNVKIEYQVEEVDKNQGDLTFSITEGDKVRIKEIEFEGNETFSDEDLEDELKTSEKGFFSWITSSGELNKEDLEQDVSKLTAFYQNNGFVQARIGEPEITFKDNWIYIKIKVHEGPRFEVGNVTLEGDLIMPEDQLMMRVLITEEAYFNREILRKDVVSLTDIYSDQGYAYADIIPKLDEDMENQVVHINIKINKGSPVFFEKIIIGGNTRTRDKVIRRQFEVYEGELFSGKRLRRSVRNLHRLGYFEDVQVDTRKGSGDDQMILNIDVKEKSTGTFSVGGGYSSVEKFFGTASITERNLFGRGLTLDLKANVGSVTQRVSVDLMEPWLFDTPLSAGVQLYTWNFDYDTYEKDSTGGSIRAGYPIYTDTRLFLKYTYDIADVINIDEDAAQSIKELAGKNTTSAILGSLYYDTRDRFFYTTRGQDHEVSVEYAGLGGDITFIKYLGKLSVYFPLVKGLVGFINTEGGYVTNHGNGLLPDYDKFYMGGIHSLRGYEWREVSATDENGDDIGGNSFVQLNAEIHIPLLKEQGVLGVLFFDTGNVFGEGESIDLGNLRQTAGYGIRWNSPMGPIRLERGHIIDSVGSGARWEFAMEASF